MLIYVSRNHSLKKGRLFKETYKFEHLVPKMSSYLVEEEVVLVCEAIWKKLKGVKT
jgi:hypothetical protein